MPTITPFLWFDTQAEDAAQHYVKLFPNSRIVQTERYAKAAEGVSGRPAGSVMTVVFELAGQRFTALNGGPVFKMTEAISFMVECADQAEIDHYWTGLSADPHAEQCGWLKDRFGVSWQIVPKQLQSLVKKNPERVMAALLKMKKLMIADLEAAAQT